MPPLFSNFAPVSKKIWKEQLLQELKGRPYESLLWKLPEGFSFEPYYTNEEAAAVAAASANLVPESSQAGVEARQWVNLQYLAVEDVELANRQALQALQGGATGVLFDLRATKEMPDFHLLLKDVMPEHCILAFRVEEVGQKVLAAFLKHVEMLGLTPDQIQGFIAFDPLGYLSETGLIDNDRLRAWAQVAKTTLAYPHFRSVMVDSGTYHNAGASAVQEIAFMLHLVSEYLHRLTELEMAPEEAFRILGFSVALGSRYFVEIAKLRALRLLVAQMARAYGIENFQPSEVYIHAYTGRWTKSRLDVYNNMLRNTTEAMSGILGGCNALSVMPHDAVLGKSSDFSIRIARNVSNILQQEAYFGKMKDPVAGAYYPELLTQRLAEESWKLFLELEEDGGYVGHIENGMLKDLTEQVRMRRNEEVATRQQRIVGVNAYCNPQEELNLPPGMHDRTGVLLRQQGQADAFERLRSRTLKFQQERGRQPKALLLLFGDPAMRSARAAFAADFLWTAGFITQEVLLPESQQELELLLQAAPDMVVLCAADADYEQQVIDLSDQMRAVFAGVLLVAANPDKLSHDIRNAALDGFIHLKSNAVQVLSQLQDQIFVPDET